MLAAGDDNLVSGDNLLGLLVSIGLQYLPLMIVDDNVLSQ